MVNASTLLCPFFRPLIRVLDMARQGQDPYPGLSHGKGQRRQDARLDRIRRDADRCTERLDGPETEQTEGNEFSSARKRRFCPKRAKDGGGKDQGGAIGQEKRVSGGMGRMAGALGTRR